MPNRCKSKRALLSLPVCFQEVTAISNFLCNLPEIYYSFTNIYVNEYICIYLKREHKWPYGIDTGSFLQLAFLIKNMHITFDSPRKKYIQIHAQKIHCNSLTVRAKRLETTQMLIS